MEFLKQMKKREYIEMGLKTAIGILLGIIVIFFMEAMIYSIYINAIDDNATYGGTPYTAEYYISKTDDNKFDVYVHYTETNQWGLKYKSITQAKLDEKLEDAGKYNGLAAARYKITTSNDETFEMDINNTTAYSQVVSTYSENNEGVTFSVYTRESAESEYPATADSANLTYAQLTELFKSAGEFKEYSGIKVFERTPNCFDIYMSAVHYVVMFIFLAIIGGVYAWRFVLIGKEYKKLEKKFKKTGKIF